MYTTLKRGGKSVRVIASHHGDSIFLSWWQIKKIRRALGMDTREEMSEGVGDPRYEWVRNRREWKGAIFRPARR